MDGVEGVSVSDGVTLLRDLQYGAELSVTNGRLARGAGYRAANSSSRHALARTGAILRLRQRNRFFVHASGVVDPTGRAFVFVGGTGTGKSTIAFALLRRGWTLLGDDGVVLEPLEDCVIVHGWRSPLLVSHSLGRFFPELHGNAHRAIAGDLRGRVPVEAHLSSRANLAALIFVEQAPHGGLSPCSAHEALMSLVRQSPWVLLGDRFTREHLSALQHIVSATRLFSFNHGPAELLRIGELFDNLE